MKRNPLSRFLPDRLVLIIAPLLAAWPQRSHAASGAWNADAGDNWSVATRWSPAVVPGTAAGDVVDFLFNISAARTVTIDATSRSAGDVNIGDPTATLFGYTIASSATSVVLNLDGTGTTDATVDFRTNIANTISAPLTLVDNAVFRSNVPGVQTLSGVISGTGKTVTFNNDTDGAVTAAVALNGQFLVTGNNTYTGGTTISDVRVNITTNNTALGAAGSAVTIPDGGQVFASTGLSTINYAFNIAGNGWVETTAGQPLGALRLEGGPTITGPVTLSADAAIGGNGTGTINGVISGPFVLSKRGTGTTSLGGANLYAGGTVIGNGSLQLNNNTAAGPGSISLIAGGATNPTRLFVNGGVTAANNINIGATFNTVGMGALQQTGTGLGTLNGAINVTGTPTAGGHFVGGNSATNALVLNGPITSSVSLVQRDGFVRYSGGGTGYNSIQVSGTAQLGATNGIATTAVPQVGISVNAVLDLNGFNQSLPAIQLGNSGAGSTLTGTIALGGNTLTLDGDLTTVNVGTGNVSNAITATAGGNIDFGATPRNLVVADNSVADDLVISTATLNGAGLTKTGAGTVALNGANIVAPLTVSTGTVQIGTATTVGSATIGSVNFADATTLRMKAGVASDLLTVTGPGGFVNSGMTNLAVNQSGGLLPNGSYPLINYTGASPGTGTFNLSVGHATASLVDAAGVISLNVTDNDRVIWDGTNTSEWATGATGNWKRQTGLAATDYFEGDDVIFQDGPTSTAVNMAANLYPSNVTFTNTTTTPYTVTGTGGIRGTTGLTKTGNGLLTLSNQNSYAGPTMVNAGTLTLDYTTIAPLPASNPISIPTGSTLVLSHAGGTFNLANPISGSGTVIVDPSTTTAGNRDFGTGAVTWNTSGFNGTLRLAPTTGTMRIQVDNPADIGSGTLEIANGGQILVTTANLTFPNDITIAGTGWSETAGFLGAIRANNPSTFTGAITLSGAAKIGALGGSMNVTNSLSGGALTFGGSNNNNAENLVITGNASGLTSLTVNDGVATGNANTITVIVGNGTASGTIGTVPVSLLADAFKSAVIRFDRTNGYTLGAGITSTSAAANHLRTFVDLDSTGTGFSDGGQSITLGTASPGTGGTIRVGQARSNVTATLTGTSVTEKIGVSNALSGALLNIGTGANITTNFFSISEAANATGGVVNQTDGTVNVVGQLRAGHFGTETSTYNISGGSLTLSGTSPTVTPSTANAGGANATGDNNVNGGATATIHGGGIYLGIDGTGIFNHSGGTVTTNWIVLDNRADTAAGTNMPDGIDRYNLSGSGILNLRSNYGLIGRNTSTAVGFAGGTVRVDNGGNGTGTGANITIPLDANITVSGPGTTLDTNGAGNGFTLNRNVAGAGTLTLTGGGTVNLTTTGTQVVTPPLATSGTGVNLAKLGAGTTTLTGSGAGFTGGVTVSAGRLNLAPGMAPASLTLAAGTTVNGEPTVAGIASFNGGTLVFDPNSAGTLTTGVLDVNGANLLDLSTIPTAAGPWTAITYGSKTGVGSFAVANPGNYRVAPAVVDTGSSITLNVLQGKTIAWTGAISNAWNINSTANWVDTNPPNLPETFYNADIAVFPDGGLNPGVALTGMIIPLAVVVPANTTGYTFTSTAGNQLSGPAGITKTGGSTLTLVGPNVHAGVTDIGGGAVSIASAASLGNGDSTNGIALSNGGKLVVTAANDLGAARAINVASTGGGFTMSNTAAQTVTISGNVTGSGPLAFQSTLAGNGTFLLSGVNSGYSGNIGVTDTSTGLTTLTIANQAAAPAGGSITVNYPPAGANGNANTLSLPNISLPATVGLNMTSLTSGTLSLRSQLVSNGASSINGPITLAGSAFIQANASGTLTFNGNITESAPFSSGFLFRGTGTHILNSNINLPTAGSTIFVTDGATLLVNTAGNVASSSQSVFGTVRLGINDGLPTAGTLVLGQAGDQVCTVDLNGFNQTVSTLSFAAPTGNLLTKGISNTHPSATSTLTVNQAADTSFNGTFSGRINLVKEGANSLTLPAAASTFNGSLTVNNGSVVGSSLGNAAGASGCLGAANVAGRQISVNAPGTLSFTSNNIFGNGVGNSNLPTLNVTGTTVNSTRYNTVGPVVLNGGTLSQSATDSGAYEGYQFKGSVTVGGATASTISSGNGKANHLDANTMFSVGDATASSAPDLVVSNPLRNQSGDFGQLTGGLTETGAGTMQLAPGTTHTYTGATNVSGGVLQVDGVVATSSVAVNSGGTLGGTGTLTQPVVVASGGTVAPGASVGTLNFGTTLMLNTGSTYAVEITGAAANDKVNATGALTANGTIAVTLTGYVPVSGDTFDIADASSITGTPAFDFSAAALTAGLEWDTTQFSTNGTIRVTVSTSDPFDAWAASYGLTGGKNGDDDGDGDSNLLEFSTNASPVSGSSSARAFGKVHLVGGENAMTLTVAVRKGAVFAAGGANQVATKDMVVYTVEASDDLINWNVVTVTELSAADAAAVQAALPLPTLDADWEWHSFRTDGGTDTDPRDTIRLSVAAQP